MRFLIIFVLAIPAALAQHAASGHAATARRSPMARTPGNRSARVGNPFVGPYWGSYWPNFEDSGSWNDYYREDSASSPNVFLIPPPPLHPVQTVIHEYAAPAATSDAGAAFTIALKDGSQQSATAAWVQGGKLHYLDSQERQQVLSPDLIDRQTTDRLNEEKHLRLQLPPN